MTPNDPLFRVAHALAQRMLEQRPRGCDDDDPSLIVDEILQSMARIFDFGERRAALRTQLSESLRHIHHDAR